MRVESPCDTSAWDLLRPEGGCSFSLPWVGSIYQLHGNNFHFLHLPHFTMPYFHLVPLTKSRRKYRRKYRRRPRARRALRGTGAQRYKKGGVHEIKYQGPGGIGFTKNIRTPTQNKVRALPGIAPREAVVNFKYCQVYQIAGNGSNKTLGDTYIMNNPNGLANKALGWEEWSAFYSAYKILECSIHIVVHNKSTLNNPMPYKFASFITDAIGLVPDSTTLTWTDWCEYPRVNVRSMPGVDTDILPSKKISCYHKLNGAAIHRFLDKRNQTYQAPWKTFPTGTPTDTLYINTLIGRPDEGVIATTELFQMDVTYSWKVLLGERKQLAKGT